MTRRLGILCSALAFGATVSACGYRFQHGVPGFPGNAATATPVATPAPGTVLGSDNFSNPAAGLLARNCLSAAAAGKALCGYVNGEYQLEVIDPDYPGVSVYVQGAYVPAYPNADVALDVSVRLAETGTGLPSVWVRCRMAPLGTRGYSFGIQPTQGTFSLSRIEPGSDGAGPNFVDLVHGPSAAIHQGMDSNHLKLTCNGSTITASINGQAVASVQDSTYRAGGAQLVAGVPEGTTTGVVDARFSNLVLTQP